MRKESMGIGIFLANAAVLKLNGTVELFNLKQGGAKTLIKLPLSPSAMTWTKKKNDIIGGRRRCFF
ncbi:MAG: K+-sensing histidine kinase KdpD [Pseudohongiellaceae bacterium]|jgi:K+-sensing histidine kinase KdpD